MLPDVSKADKAAAEANPKGIAQVNYISMVILGTLFAVISILCYVGGTAMADTLQQIATDYSWFTAGLTAAGGMMKFVEWCCIIIAGIHWYLYRNLRLHDQY